MVKKFFSFKFEAHDNIFHVTVDSLFKKANDPKNKFQDLRPKYPHKKSKYIAIKYTNYSQVWFVQGCPCSLYPGGGVWGRTARGRRRAPATSPCGRPRTPTAPSGPRSSNSAAAPGVAAPPPSPSRQHFPGWEVARDFAGWFHRLYHNNIRLLVWWFLRSQKKPHKTS